MMCLVCCCLPLCWM
uniref:Uncharacterized protein n=1 Tax=Arundo donax TaxID=35708 RepID=A0A0A9B147_ARUDO